MRLPENFEEYEANVMSNFDGEIDNRVAESIKLNPVFSRYPGWNFNGKVWWQDGQFHCEVWVYGGYQETFSSLDLQIIMDDICNKYGYQ